MTEDTRELVLVDMDGTLADVRHRLHYIRQPGRRKDWKRFFAQMHNDPPIREVVDWVRGLSPQYRIVIVTGRPEEFRETSIEWLSRNRIPWDDIFMRPNGDHRPDYVVKREILEGFGPARSRVAFVIDDRPAVCDMWRAAGLKCHQIRGDEAVSADYQ